MRRRVLRGRCQRRRPRRDLVLFLSGRQALHPSGLTRVHLWRRAFLAEPLDTAHKCHPVSSNAAGSRRCRSFLRFCCGLNRSLFDPRPLRAAWRPKPVRLAGRVRVLPQRRFGVSSPADQPCSSHRLWTLGLTACPVLKSRTRREDRHEPDQLRAFDETG
jgi:hypothetical protein